MTHSPCYIRHRLPVEAGALATITTACIISTFVSLPGACEGYVQGLGSLLGLLATGTGGLFLPSAQSVPVIRRSAAPTASGEQRTQMPVQGRRRRISSPVRLRNTQCLAHLWLWMNQCASQPAPGPGPVLSMYWPYLNSQPQAHEEFTPFQSEGLRPREVISFAGSLFN